MRYQSVYPSLPMLLEGQQEECVCVRLKGVSQRQPVGEQIGVPVCDFAPGWDRAEDRPLFLCVCVCVQLRVQINDDPRGANKSSLYTKRQPLTLCLKVCVCVSTLRPSTHLGQRAREQTTFCWLPGWCPHYGDSHGCYGDEGSELYPWQCCYPAAPAAALIKLDMIGASLSFCSTYTFILLFCAISFHFFFSYFCHFCPSHLSPSLFCHSQTKANITSQLFYLTFHCPTLADWGPETWFRGVCSFYLT